MNADTLRAWYWHRQGLDGSLRGATPAAILERAGWARSVGGAGPYLTLFARGRTTRAAADRAADALEIHELPAARGCTYVLPASDFALGLTVGRDFAQADMKTAAKLGVTEHEVDTLCTAVLRALDGKTLTPDEIRDGCGNAVRHLGDEGKKRGMITTLPLALGRLQAHGEIRRVPVDGRLDQQRYRYTRWTKAPPIGTDMPAAFTELARRYFRWIGPASLKAFQEFAGIGVRAASAAVQPIGLEPIGPSSDQLVLPDDAAALRRVTPSATPQYALVSSLDTLTLARRDIAALLDEQDRRHPLLTTPSTGAGSGLLELPSHAILDRGRVIGLWEFDVEAGAIAWTTFSAKKTRELRTAVEETETFVREQLGDARSFSLDSPKSRQPRIDALRR